MRSEVHKDLQLYWSYIDDIVILDGITKKGKRIILASLQGKVLNYLYMNHMGIEKTRLLV